MMMMTKILLMMVTFLVIVIEIDLAEELGLDKEQEPIKRRKGQEATGQRHEAKQHKGKGICGQNVLHSTSGCAAGAWQKLGSYILKAILITSVLGE